MWICSEPFAYGDSVVVRDEVVRESDPAYRANPAAFDPIGLPSAERRGPLDSYFEKKDAQERAAAEAAEEAFQAAARANKVTLRAEPPQVFRATSDIATHIDGRPALLQRGSTVLSGHPLLAEHPEGFTAKR